MCAMRRSLGVSDWAPVSRSRLTLTPLAASSWRAVVASGAAPQSRASSYACRSGLRESRRRPARRRAAPKSTSAREDVADLAGGCAAPLLAAFHCVIERCERGGVLAGCGQDFCLRIDEADHRRNVGERELAELSFDDLFGFIGAALTRERLKQRLDSAGEQPRLLDLGGERVAGVGLSLAEHAPAHV
jgi:hypothetical protein